MKLKNSQIDFIISDLNSRGLIYQPLHDEIVDHFCAIVEENMDEGIRFHKAYRMVLAQFGNGDGLINIQNDTLLTINSNTLAMINNYLKIALRNLKKHRFYSLINIMGLSIGLACCLLITLYVLDELSYDRHHEKSDRIYRVANHINFGGNDTKYTVSPAPMAEAMMNEIPEVEVATRFRSWGSFLVKRQDNDDNFKEYNLIWSDPQVVDVFTIPFIEGDPSTALTEPNTLIISESIAKKYFQDEDPLNKTLILNNDMNYKITGVYKDMPSNSHFHFNIMMAMSGLDESKNGMWLSNNFQTYFVLRQGADPQSVEQKLNDLLFKYIGPQVLQFMGMTLEELEEQGSNEELFLQPLEKIHLHSDLTVEFESNGDIRYVYIFSVIALFILTIALVNFMNLATARSSDRAKEVGIRKVLGSYRIYLVRQFLAESVIFTFISIIISLILANIALPFFNSVSGKSLSIPFESFVFWLVIFTAILVIGILAGLYPAFFLSSFKPVSIFQGKYTRGSRGSITRSVLVVFQFATSIMLIIGTIAVYNQLNYITHKKLGYDKDQVVLLDDTFVLGNQINSFKNEMLRNPAIKSASISSFLPVQNSARSNTTLWKKGTRTPESSVNMQVWNVDEDYIQTMGMHILKGRSFSPEFPGDSTAIVLNETAAEQFGYDDPLGQEIESFTFTDDNAIDENKTTTYRVIGIVENFHFESLRDNIGSLGMLLNPSNGMISFRYDAVKTAEVINDLKSKWKEMAPGQPFQYNFLDEQFGLMYSGEKRTGQIFMSFAILAIIIACLGLFALAAFMAEQRTKEIGVRKVMGATTSNIIFMLSKDFGKLVIIAFIIAIPVAWYGITEWLSGFAYKDIPGIMLYGVAGLVALLIAWLTVGYQSFKAASANPALSLRDE